MNIGMTWVELVQIYVPIPAGKYMFKVNHRNTLKRCEKRFKVENKGIRTTLGLFPYPPKNQRFFDVFKGYRQRPGVVLVSLLLTLTIFTSCFIVSVAIFEQVIFHLFLLFRSYCFKTTRSSEIKRSGNLARKNTIVYFLETLMYMPKLDLTAHSILLRIST